MQLRGKSLLGGLASGEGSSAFRAVDPFDRTDLDPLFCEATDEEIDRAVELAEESFDSYRRKTPDEKAAFLEQVAEEIEILGDRLTGRANAETGLPQARLVAERGRTTSQLRLFAEVVREGSWVDARIDRAVPDRKPVPKPDLRRMLVPLGPVVVFGASNFPLAFSVAGGDTASALAAGCPVVAKAHPAHPGTSELVARAVQRALRKTAMPDGLFSLIQATRPEASIRLVQHPLTRAVGFTGSLRAGRALYDAAAARRDPIPVYAEMGSINPVFLLPRALAEEGKTIAEGLLQSVTLGVGQFCTNPGLVVGLAGEALNRFLIHLGELVAESKPGTMLHSGILSAYESGVQRFKETPGVSVIAECAAKPNPEKTEAGAFLFATDAATFLEKDFLSEEVFGPSTLVVQCESSEEIRQIARHLEGNLTASLHATEEDLEGAEDLIGILERKVGRLVLNGFPTGVEVCPAMHHGGPYPATTDSRSTSVGTAAIVRFARPVCYQDFPDTALPVELRGK